MAIDRSLNYGRHLLAGFAREAAPFKVALDLGAGHGDDLAALALACPTAELHGVEYSEEYRADLKDRGVVVHDLNLEVDPLPFKDESVDLILINQTLEHLKDVFWVLHEVTRTLSVGGALLIGVPNLASLHNRLLLLVGRQPTSINNSSAHVRGYTRRDLLRLLECGHPSGYAVRGYGGSNFYPFGPRIAQVLAGGLPSLAWGLFLYLEKTRSYAAGFLDYPVTAKLETRFFLGPAR